MASSDEYSDLTDLDDNDYGPSSSSKSKSKPRRRASPVGGGYRIRNALKAPRATTYTAQALYDQMHSDDIKLDPEYQRDVVWPDTKMVGLIDSVLRNFYIPPVIFSVVSFDDGSEKKICIDGKQRLTSIQRFMDGMIPHRDPVTGEKLWYTDTGGKNRRKVLPEHIRTLFKNKQVVCVEYQDVTDSDEREIFQRVQLGMALTPAEKLQVISTPRASFIRSLVSHFLTPSPSSSSSPGAGSLASLDFDRARGADFRCLAQTVHCLHTPLAALNGAGALAKLERFLSDPARFTPEFEGRVRAALGVVGEMAGAGAGGGDGVFGSPVKVAPVEFVMVGLLVGTHMGAAGCGVKEGGKGGREMGEREEREREGRRRLAEGVRRMRADVRVEHVDIRMNDRVARTMIEFIRRWKPGPSASSSASASSSSASAGKRKRRDEGEDGEVAKDKQDKQPRMKFKKAPPAPAPAPAPAPHPVPAKPVGLPPKPLPQALPTPRSTPAIGAGGRPDRMAALRAAQAQAQSQSQGYTPTQGYAPTPPQGYPQNFAPSQGGYGPSQGPNAGYSPTVAPGAFNLNLEAGLMGRQGSGGGGGGGGGWGGAPDAGWGARGQGGSGSGSGSGTGRFGGVGGIESAWD
ncbi:hypothetical protein FPV67DRAFT_1707864 [Lyophyllum atratum]|nr:hypothetical protein FPV67DRAFT_1707864 [Lyophyllum atratum]